jgi:hypothetical protein
MAYLTRADNLAAIAAIVIKRRHGDLTALRRWQALDIIKRNVSEAGTLINAYPREENEAVQALMLRLVHDDQH